MRHFILDTDWWTDCDDVVAVRLLCNAHRQGIIDLLGIDMNACMPYSSPSLDVFTRDCGVEVPLAVDHAATGFAGEARYQEHLARSGEVKRRNEDVPDGVDFYRQLLAEAEDGSVEVLSIGFTQVLAGLLRSPGGRDLVGRKARHLWIMAGKWDEAGGREYNFHLNEITRRSAAELCKFWPTPITFLGWEVGHSVISGRSLPEGDLLKQAMTDHGSANGRSSWDPMLALLAITGDPAKAGYRCVYGHAEVDESDGGNHFTEDPQGPHRYVVKLREDAWYAAAIDARLPKSAPGPDMA